MIGKQRNPVTVWLLVIVTFGIYGLYWWYKANEEVGDFDPLDRGQPDARRCWPCSYRSATS